MIPAFGFFHTLRFAVVLLAMGAGGGAHSHQTDCYAHPSRCGYPDAGNVGVPRGTKLAGTGGMTIDEDGAVISGKRIEGKVIVDADDVTIRDSSISPTEGGSGAVAVQLEQGADNFTIKDSEVAGRDKRNGLESAVWNHYNNPGASAVGDYFHGCADCWEGSGRFIADYMLVDASYPGSHNEDIYVCGGAVRVEHSTLINRVEQTATVFGDTADCGGNRFVVTDSLLAGGGYVLYPQANSETPTGWTKVEDNRFARCRTRATYDASSGGRPCSGGPDSSGLFPGGGYYGLAAYFYAGPKMIWRGNRWDDDLQPVCPYGTCHHH